MEDAVVPISAFRQRLRAVFEGVRRRFHAAIGDWKSQSVLIKLKICACSLTPNAAGNHSSGHSQALGMRLAAHALQFFNRYVIALALLDAGKCELGERADDHRNGDSEAKISTGAGHCSEGSPA